MANPLQNDSQPISNTKSRHLENAVLKIEGRRNDLEERQEYLKDKISAMERSIPTLLAFNMWTSRKKCNKSSTSQIRQIMSMVSSLPDPTDKLLDNLRNSVKTLNAETAKFHDKIIAADVQLQESNMELKSLETANKEFENILTEMEKDLGLIKTSSLNSIRSDDLTCLSAIRELGEHEINLKNSIRELEERELIFREQINRILTSEAFKDCNSGRNGKQKCPKFSRLNKLPHVKANCAENVNNLEYSEFGVRKKSRSKCPSSTHSQFCCSLLAKKNNETPSDSKGCRRCCKTIKAANPCQMPGHSLQRRQIQKTCDKCNGLMVGQNQPTAVPQSNRSQHSCDCSEYLKNLDDGTEEVKTEARKITIESASDEEYSDCCDCGCEISDFSDH